MSPANSIRWTKCPECGRDMCGRGQEAAVKLFSHRLVEHDKWTFSDDAIRSMTETIQDKSTLPEIEAYGQVTRTPDDGISAGRTRQKPASPAAPNNAQGEFALGGTTR